MMLWSKATVKRAWRRLGACAVLCLGAEAAFAASCEDPYFYDIALDTPLLGPISANDSGTVACLITCYESAEAQARSGASHAQQLYRQSMAPKLDAEQIDQVLSAMRVLYSTHSSTPSSHEVCTISEVPIPGELALLLYAQAPTYSVADQEKLLDALASLENAGPGKTALKQNPTYPFKPTLTISGAQDSAGAYIERIIRQEAEKTGIQVSNQSAMAQLVIALQTDISGNPGEGYEMQLLLSLSEPGGVDIGSLDLSSNSRTNANDPESRLNLARLTMAGSDESVGELLQSGKNYLRQQGGASYRIEAQKDTGISTKAMRWALESIGPVVISSIAQEGSSTVARVRFTGNISTLYAVIEQRLNTLYESAGLASPSIELRGQEINIEYVHVASFR